MNFYYFCVFLELCSCFEIYSVFPRIFPLQLGIPVLSLVCCCFILALSLVVFLVFPYFPRCCLLLHTTKLVYPFLLGNISGFSGAFWLHCSLEGAGGEMLGGWKSRVGHSQPVTIFHAVVSFSFTEILPLAVR